MKETVKKLISKFSIQIFILCLFALFSMSTNVAAEVLTKDIHLFVYYGGGDRDTLYSVDGKEILLKAGEIRRRELTSFEEGSDVGVENMDLEFELYNKNKEPVSSVRIQLEVIPQLAHIKYIEGDPEGAINERESSANVKWSKKPIITRSKILTKLKADSHNKIIFDKIKLNDIIDKYLKNKQWPTALKFVITIEFDGKKKNQSRILKIPFRTY